MAKILRYWGEFASECGVLWRFEILQETGGVAYSAQEVIMPPSPLSIEWSRSAKYEPIKSSSATLTLESNTDRRFIDLYQVEVGAVVMNVYRNGVFYWSGTLDTELYEEPYSYNQNYDVSLTFSDFAPLDRLKWSVTGLITIEQIITETLNKSGIDYNAELAKYISTKRSSTSATSLTLTELQLSCDNFYDEDSEPMSVIEVLKSVLQPLALSIVQKAGRIIIYDLNAISKLPTTKIEWDSTDAVLGVDETFNSINLTFSPYAQSELINGEVNKEKTAQSDSGTMVKYSGDKDAIDGFILHISDEGDNLTLSNGAKFYRITPIYSGSEDAGVVYMAQTFNFRDEFWQNIGTDNSSHGVYSNGAVISEEIIKTATKFLPYLNRRGEKEYQLRISLDLLFDTRYNPFEQPSGNNEDGNHQLQQDWCNFGYVPIMLTLRDASGVALYHLENKDTMLSNSFANKGIWSVGEAVWGDAFLAYYDKNDRKGKSGFGSWATNRQSIGYTRDPLPVLMDKRSDGEYISLPPSSGWLELKIGSGVHQFDYSREEKNIHPLIHWLMYKNPTVELVNANGLEYDAQDVEYRAWINNSAKEELDIQTTVGSMSDVAPSARGQLLDLSKMPIKELHRAGVTDVPEKLLIGSIYSQYAKRSAILSGTVEIMPYFSTCRDEATEGTFVVVDEVQNLAADQSEISVVELHAESYQGIEYEEL